MIGIKQEHEIVTMRRAGALLSEVFDIIAPLVKRGIKTSELDARIEQELVLRELTGCAKGYKGYRHVSCISTNDEVVHGVPDERKALTDGDIVSIDVCASWRGYCADMTRTFFVGTVEPRVAHFVQTAQQALDAGISQARAGNRVVDISRAVQQVVERNGYSVIRDFAGHGIGTQMHEEPEITNFVTGQPSELIKVGMTFAIEPMISMGNYHVFIAPDGWTVKTRDKSLAAHIEDTVLVTPQGPEVLTRLTNRSEGL